MNPKVILGLLMSAGVGALLPIGNASAAVLSEQSETARQSVIQVEVVDLKGRDSSRQLIAGNSSSNSSSNDSSNSSSNDNSNSSSNSSSNDNSNSSSNQSSDDD
jgi:hypothetical protein